MREALHPLVQHAPQRRQLCRDDAPLNTSNTEGVRLDKLIRAFRNARHSHLHITMERGAVAVIARVEQQMQEEQIGFIFGMEECGMAEL